MSRDVVGHLGMFADVFPPSDVVLSLSMGGRRSFDRNVMVEEPRSGTCILMKFGTQKSAKQLGGSQSVKHFVAFMTLCGMCLRDHSLA